MSDMPAAFGCEQRKARKEHKCCECHSPIKIGETYAYSHGVWDGRGASFKQCLGCDEVMKAAAGKSDWDEMPEFTNISEWLREYQRNVDDTEWMKIAADDLSIDVSQIEKIINRGVKKS